MSKRKKRSEVEFTVVQAKHVADVLESYGWTVFPDSPLYCPQCGHDGVPLEWDYCAECGHCFADDPALTDEDKLQTALEELQSAIQEALDK